MPSFLLALFLLIFFEVGAAVGWINPALIPPPSQVLKTMVELKADFAQAFFETSLNVLAGFVLSAVLGLAIAFVLSLSEFLRRAILPFAIFFQTVPIIAIAPLLVIYFGFGAPTVIAASAIVSIFPILAGALLGLQSLDPGELELFRLYGADRSQILKRLRIPSAYPQIYGGLKVAAGLAVIGAVAGEFVAGGGLGALIDSARTQQRIDIVFAALLLLSILGLALIAALQFTHRRIQKHRPYGRNLKD